MKKIVIYIAIIIFSTQSLQSADSLEVEKTFDYGRYLFIVKTKYAFINPTELKAINDEILSYLPYPAKLTDDFPSTPSFEFEYNMTKSTNTLLSLGIHQHSTGSRINYQDYSGEHNVDMILNTFGVNIGFIFFPKSKIDFIRIGFGANLGMVSKTTKINESVRIRNQSVSRTEKINETSMTFEPGMTIAYVNQYFLLGINSGYLFDFKGEIMDDFENISDIGGFRVGLIFALNTNLF